jgi:hypothetical protein
VSVVTRSKNRRAKVPCDLPSLDEFVKYALSKNISERDAREQFEAWEASEGYDGAGNPILRWKGKLVDFRNSHNLPSHKRALRNGSSNHQQPAKETPLQRAIREARAIMQ